jgi:hypothetical protein
MQEWWKQNEKLIPESYTEEDDVKDFKSRVEDLTGSIPLLLDECVVNEKIDLYALEKVETQVRRFMVHIKNDIETTAGVWET